MGGEKKSAAPQVVGIDCWRSRRGFFPHLYHRHHYYQPRSGQHSYLLSRFDFAAKKIEKVCTREPHHLSVCGARAYPIHSTHSKREEATATKKKREATATNDFICGILIRGYNVFHYPRLPQNLTILYFSFLVTISSPT